MIESYNSKFKQKHIHLLDLSCCEKIPDQLPGFKLAVNNIPHALLGTLTPNEVLSGLRPWKDIWPQMKSNIEDAKAERIFINQLSCCDLSNHLGVVTRPNVQFSTGGKTTLN